MNEESHQVSVHRPPPSITADTLKKVMWLYRTRTCPLNKRGQCNYGSRCFDSHESQPERRAPKQNEYNDWHPSTMKCTSNADESCKYGRACYFAHNDFEVNYHPTMYKTQLCGDFEKEGSCSLGMICPHYHYPDEQRKIEKGSLSADCKSDGISRKAPPPQEFRRWLDEELRLAKLNEIHTPHNTDTMRSNANGHSTKEKKEKKSIVEEPQQATTILGNDHNKAVPPHAPHNLNLNENELHPITPIHAHSHPNHPDTTTSNGIENEVEIELPSTQQHTPHSLMEDSLTSSPYQVEPHIDEKWHQHHLRYNNNNQSRPDQHYIPNVPAASPHLNRALSTPTTVTSDMPPPSHIQHAHSHQGAPSIASYRSNRSSNRSQKSGKSSSKSKSSTKGQARNGSKRKSPKHNAKKKKRSRRKLEKNLNDEKQAIDVINSYKVTRCTKSKCNDVYCVNYHNLEDRRRSPLSYNYIGEACARIFDSKTRKFTDNCYGCPANENCEYAHNYLEIWYHPKVFHTKRCPFIKYQKSCPWGFKCSHYHKKAHKRSLSSLMQVQQQQQQKYSPQSSSQYSNHSQTQAQQQTYAPHIAMPHPHHAAHPMAMHTPHTHGPPPNLVATHAHAPGPHRPPLTTNRAKAVASPQQQQQQMMSSEMSSPYSANSFSPHSVQHQNHNMNNMNHLGMQAQPQQQQHQNGLMSPHFDASLNVQNKASPHNHHQQQNDASYSYNPLMQGIAPSIHSWRQKMDKNVGY
eukprot:171085_1